MEKEIADLKAANIRQAKELENEKRTKKKLREDIENERLKKEEFENVLLVEQKTTKQLNKQIKTMETNIIQLQQKITQANKAPNISNEKLQKVLEQKQFYADQNHELAGELAEVTRSRDLMTKKYNENVHKLNNCKKVLEESHVEALRLETMIKMYPDKTKLFKLTQEIFQLKEQIKNKDDFELNGTESENSQIIEENLKLTKETTLLRKNIERLTSWQNRVISKYKISEEFE
jgi:chromosome segregation ATPase